jgi:hypothetical protein
MMEQLITLHIHPMFATMSLPSPPINGILPTVTGEQVMPENIIQKNSRSIEAIAHQFQEQFPQTLGGGHLKFYGTV